jgi:hypothetical protein
VEKEVEARVGQESKRGLLISEWRHGARRRLRTSRLSPGRAASFCIDGQHFSDSEIEVPDVLWPVSQADASQTTSGSRNSSDRETLTSSLASACFWNGSLGRDMIGTGVEVCRDFHVDLCGVPGDRSLDSGSKGRAALPGHPLA